MGQPHAAASRSNARRSTIVNLFGRYRVECSGSAPIRSMSRCWSRLRAAAAPGTLLGAPGHGAGRGLGRNGLRAALQDGRLSGGSLRRQGVGGRHGVGPLSRLGGARPALPVVLLAAGDGNTQTGIRQFATLDYPLARAVVGEPTRLAPDHQHKGVVGGVTVTAAALPQLPAGIGPRRVPAACSGIWRTRAASRRDVVSPWMTGPTVTVTMIHGGRTHNAVADECTLSVDFRVLPGMQPAGSRDELISSLAALGLEITHGEVQVMMPPLATAAEDPFARRALEVCRRVTGRGDLEFAGAPYGTDAAWVAEQASTIVLGPGGIETAHAVDEHVEIAEVVSAARIYHDLLMTDA